MELHKIEQQLKKYFEGESTIAEERNLQAYFLSPNVAPHLQQYVLLFTFYAQEKKVERPRKTTSTFKNQRVIWFSVAAAMLVFLGVYKFSSDQNNAPKVTTYGTFETPEEAFAATQKALNLLSENVNVGVHSVTYLNEFEDSKNKIFKTN